MRTYRAIILLFLAMGSAHADTMKECLAVHLKIQEALPNLLKFIPEEVRKTCFGEKYHYSADACGPGKPGFQTRDYAQPDMDDLHCVMQECGIEGESHKDLCGGGYPKETIGQWFDYIRALKNQEMTLIGNDPMACIIVDLASSNACSYRMANFIPDCLEDSPDNPCIPKRVGSGKPSTSSTAPSLVPHRECYDSFLSSKPLGGLCGGSRQADLELGTGVAIGCVDNFSCEKYSWLAERRQGSAAVVAAQAQRSAVYSLLSDRYSQLRTKVLASLARQAATVLGSEQAPCGGGAAKADPVPLSSRLKHCGGVDGAAIAKDSIVASHDRFASEWGCSKQFWNSPVFQKQAGTLAVHRCLAMYVKQYPETGPFSLDSDATDRARQVADFDAHFWDKDSTCYPVRNEVYAMALPLLGQTGGGMKQVLSGEKREYYHGRTDKEQAVYQAEQLLACVETATDPRLLELTPLALHRLSTGEDTALPSYRDTKAFKQLMEVFDRACKPGGFSLDELEELVGKDAKEEGGAPESEAAYRDAKQSLVSCTKELRGKGSETEQAFEALEKGCDAFNAAAVPIAMTGPQGAAAASTGALACAATSGVEAYLKNAKANKLTAIRRALGRELSCDQAADLMRESSKNSDEAFSSLLSAAFSAGVEGASVLKLVKEGKRGAELELAIQDEINGRPVLANHAPYLDQEGKRWTWSKNSGKYVKDSASTSNKKQTLFANGVDNGVDGNVHYFARASQDKSFLSTLGAKEQNPVGNPYWVKKILGDDTAKALGFDLPADPKGLRIGVPDADKLNIAIGNLNARLEMAHHDPIALRFYEADAKVSIADYLRRYANDGALPIGKPDMLRLHDVDYHVPALVFPKRWVDHSRLQVKTYLDFKDYLLAKYKGDAKTLGLLETWFDKAEAALTVRIDTGTGNFVAKKAHYDDDAAAFVFAQRLINGGHSPHESITELIGDQSVLTRELQVFEQGKPEMKNKLEELDRFNDEVEANIKNYGEAARLAQ